jgi:uncharacterized protein
MNDIERKKTIRRIIAFSVLVNGVAWLAPLLGGSPATPGFGFILWGVAPLLVSLVLRFATKDWSDLGIKPAIRRNIRWYAFSTLVFPILMLSALFGGVMFSVSSISEFSLTEFLKTLLIALPIFFIFAIFEEVGWRGYLSPKLDALGVNCFVAAALVAVVWATWHLPYIRELSWVYSPGDDLTSMVPRFYLACFALALVYGAVRNATGTFWPAVLMHAVGNAFGHPLSAEYVRVTAGQEYLGALGNGLFFIVFALILGVAISRWHLTASTKSAV